MNASVPLSVVLLALAGAVVSYLIYKVVKSITVSALKVGEAADRLEAALAAGTVALAAVTTATDQLRASLAPAAEELRTNMSALPKLLEAVARVGQAQLEITQAQRAEQEERKKNPFGRPNAPMAQRDTAAANMEYEVQQTMRAEGISREEALLRMNPANSASVWEGNGLFEGWGR